MRVGDFGVELVPMGEGELRETDSGHVLARPGTVYGIRLRNHGPLRCVAEVRLDDKSVTGAGLLVIDAYGTVTLERPVHDTEKGRFTVIAEGNEKVFGPDGGRDNPALGTIAVSFRRELPREEYRAPTFVGRDSGRPIPTPGSPAPSEPFHPEPIPAPPGRPMAPPEWAPPTAGAHNGGPPQASASLASQAPPMQAPRAPGRGAPFDQIERTAGTGLTGRSSQEFITVAVGPLEAEATVIRLRLVIGTDEAFNAPRPLRDMRDLDASPVRPPARP
ncbi:MAG TPA: hypothetical protein VGM50_06645 [Gemmatimonadaceae bacterium]